MHTSSLPSTFYLLTRPPCNATQIGNKHLPNAVTEDGERRGGMRLSTYFDYFPRAAAEESGACKFVIDYDAAHLDVLAVSSEGRWLAAALSSPHSPALT